MSFEQLWHGRPARVLAKGIAGAWITTVGSIGLLAAQNYEQIEGLHTYLEDGSHEAFAFTDCPGYVDVTSGGVIGTGGHGRLLATGVRQSQELWDYAITQDSAAHETDAGQVNIRETFHDFNSLFDSEPFDTYTSERTGLIYEFFSNHPEHFNLNAAAVEDLFLLPLDRRITYFDTRMKANVDCARSALLGRDFAGTVVPIYLDGNRDECMANLRFVSSNCQSLGFTPPDIELKAGPYTIFRLPRSVILTFGSLEDTELTTQTKRKLSHELGHFLFRLMMPDNEVNRDVDEHYAVYLQGLVEPYLSEIADPLEFKDFSQ